jgi:hypothetical protein
MMADVRGHEAGNGDFRIRSLERRVEGAEKNIDELRRSGAGPDHERRLVALERFNLGVIEEQIRQARHDIRNLRTHVDAEVARLFDQLDEEVGSLRRAFYSFAFAVVGSAIAFAFTVFALIGK